MAKQKAGLRAVAELAKTSSATVDRVLNGRGGVRPELEQRVLAAARDLKLDRNLDLIPKQHLRFAVVMNEPSRYLYARIEMALREYQLVRANDHFTCYFHFFPSQDANVIVSRLTPLRRGYDGLLVVAHDHPLITETLQGLARRMPIVTLLSDIAGSGRIAFAGADNRQAGRMVGDLLARFVGGRSGRLLAITRLQTYLAHDEREIGFRRVIRERYPQLTADHAIECNEGDDNDLAKVEAYLKRQGPFVGIYSLSSWNTRILMSLHQRGLLEGLVSVAHGVSQNSRQMLLDGIVDLVVDHRPEENARAAVDALLAHHGRSQFVSPRNNHGVELFTRENLPPSALPLPSRG